MNEASEAAVARGVRPRTARQIGRSGQSRAGNWFREIDRILLLLTLLLMAIGLVAVAAASPATAYRYSGENHQVATMYYFWRQVMWVALSVPVLLAVSTLPVQFARRLAIAGAGLFLVLLALVPVIGSAANGATRWIDLQFTDFQPSEFLKPLFIVAIAWLLSLRARDPGLPVIAVTGGLTGLVALLLMLQPDFGQTVVFVSVWLALLLVSGVSATAIGGLLGTAAGGLVAAYLFYPTARMRIDAFFAAGEKSGNDHFQTEAAHATITGGGLTGTGPGGGQIKFKLPEAHTDYIFSVVGEEFGLIACAVVALLYLAIVVRVLLKLIDEEDAFRLLAAAGLAAQFGVQALVNMAVNTGMVPSKGMTLPFISYGGSSMIALSVGMGLLLAFTRRNPYLQRSPFVSRRSAKA